MDHRKKPHELVRSLSSDVAGTSLESYFRQMRGRYEFLLERMDALAGPDSLVVEAGSSPGLLTELIRRSGRKVVGLDFAPESPFVADSKLPLKNIFKEYSHNIIKTDISAGQFPLKSECADIVTMNETIEHFTVAPLPCLKEIARILKPGGLLILTTPNVASLSNRLKLLAGKNIYTDVEVHNSVALYKLHNREYTMEELETLCNKAGLSAHEKKFMNLGGAWLPPAMSALREGYYALTSLIPSCRTNLYIAAKKS